MSRQRDYQQRHTEAGLCVLCPNPIMAADKAFCETHWEANKARRKAKYQAKRAKGLCGVLSCQNKTKKAYCKIHREIAKANDKRYRLRIGSKK